VTAAIKYCTTSDGARIAFSVEGAGTPYVWMPSSSQAGQLAGGGVAAPPAFMQRWATKFKVVAYDTRGFGLSAKSPPDLSLRARLADLEAVITAVCDAPVILRAMADAGGIAAAFAATRPELVRALVLFAPYASGRELVALRPGMQEALLGLMKADRNIGAKTLITLLFGRSLPPEVEGSADISADTLALLLQATASLEVGDLLGDVVAPTLVIHGREDALIPVDLGRAVASAIPNAQLYEYDGPHMPPSWEIVNAVTSVISEFLAVQAPIEDAGGGVRTILFTDLVGHTEMMRRLGDERGRDVLRNHERITRELLKEHGGAEVKTMGDGFLASFASVTKAVDCAIALQRAFAAHEGEPLHVRVGLNAGEPVEEDGDLFGSTVIMASRIAAQAGAGEILIPETLRHLLSGKSYAYTDRGDTKLKGFEDAVRLSEVRWQDSG
jgi:class 3 adenylate cyclase/pimeloyl-ACP methyl ester carboxylesterase